jgi:hypothetical protein
MNSDTLLIRYALVFCFARTFARRSFCAFAMFRRAAADIVCFLGCPCLPVAVAASDSPQSEAIAGHPPKQNAALGQSQRNWYLSAEPRVLQATDSVARSQTASNVILPLALTTCT